MNSTETLVYLVDDEPDLLETVAEYLTRNGFAVRSATSGTELDALMAIAPPSLIVLDINMPGETGLEIARRLRAASDVPIIMLTAADDVVDKVLGLELGADDYITKPFDSRELRSRIRTVLRRSTTRTPDGQATEPEPPKNRRLRMGRVLFDRDARCLVEDDGQIAPLTAMEFDLLDVFAENPNRVLTRDRLLDLTNSRGSDPFDRSIDIRMVRIRRKIEVDPSDPKVLITVRGSGYMYVPPRKS